MLSDTSLPSKSAATVAAREFVYIDTPDALESWVAESSARMSEAGESRVCLDTEADSLHHYREKLCLLQVACAGRFALVDPLQIEDVSSLLTLMNQHDVWFHGADYDLTMLRRTYDWSPKRVFDTQIAARLVGMRQFGYAAIVKETLGVELSKASQKADWSRRPLPQNMLEYAVDDVRYLLPAADILLKRLREHDRMAWFEQSCQTLQADVAARSVAPREDPWRVQGSGRLHGKGLALLKSMWEWREGVAEQRDLPCYRVMSNKQMINLSDIFEKGSQPVPPKGWRPQWKRAFSGLVTQVDEMTPEEWPKRPRKPKGRLSEGQRTRIDQILKVRERAAEELGLEPSLLGSRSTVEGMVANPEQPSPLMGWQQAVLAEALNAEAEEPAASQAGSSDGPSA
jgi:ribonuclease D